MSNFLQLLGQGGTLLLSYPSVSIILAFGLIFLFKWFSPDPSSNKDLPPSPPKLPIIGNLHQVGLPPHRSLASLAQRHGPFMLLHFGSVPILVVSSADAAREILKTHDVIFASRPKSSMFEKLLYNCKDVASAPYGEYWRQMKSISVVHLLSNNRVRSFRAVREEETFLLIEKIKQSCSSAYVNLSEVSANFTNDVACRVALGRKCIASGDERKFKEFLGEFMELLGTIVLGDYIPCLAWLSRINGLDAKAEKVAKQFDDFLEGVIEEHISRQNKGGKGHVSREDEQQKDFVDILLWIQKENETGSTLDTVSIKALILDVFVAGTDTMSTVLEWAMTELLRHPEVMKKVQNEVRGIGGQEKFIMEDHLEKLHYLKVVIKESLRLHPPVPLLAPRESTQNVKVKGYDIATGTQVIVNTWAIGRDPMSWDEPEQFHPERFLASSIDFGGHHFQFIPFGAGRRACPGISFAMITIELVLANLLHSFDWTLPDGARGKDLDMTESGGLTVHRKVPLTAVATPYCG